ncbi:hypothetical protein DFR86_07405 [Acidianus sulfidivorans JP7]|uniref:Uncharacterized protein n=1 Tax=Acidianus sulfidivorans JP7 TaxID=619593 RepID=A0A2U9IN10_9CREN|nr:hypothetical protein [Acidianus sulfidivorans]AWR97392.1 hypothetical protein DFR86_07405 [Acidianus sulfidivorans JP7]
MLKYVEYTRHGITEPKMTVYIYKKVEDGKIVSAFRIMMYKNKVITIYEDDKLDGGDISDLLDGEIESVLTEIKKYYDESTDDLIIYGEKDYVDKLLEQL